MCGGVVRRIPVLIALFVAISSSVDARPRRPQPRRAFTASVTSYCTRGITDSGTRTRRGTVAADPRILPFGSRIRLDGLPGRCSGTYLVVDSGRAIKGTDVDIFVGDCREAKRFGRQRARVRLLRPIVPSQGTQRN